MRLVHMIVVLYFLTNLWIIWRICHWAKCYDTAGFYRVFRIVFPLLYGAMASVLAIAFFLPEGNLHKMLQRFSNYFMGIYLYLFGVCFLVDLIRLVLKRCHILKENHLVHKGILSVLGTVVFCGVFISCFYGFSHARHLYVREYTATVHKSCQDQNLKVVLVADLHMGYSVGADRIADMVEKINAQDADLVVLAGDIFDNTIEGVDNLHRIQRSLSQIKSRLGVYGCWGNHDIAERLFTGFSVAHQSEEKRSREMDQFMKDCNIHMLNDETVLLSDQIYLIGRKDYEKAGDGTSQRESLEKLTQGVDWTRPVFVLDHEPRKLQEVADAGVDLMLSGHTHEGQFFPMNLTGRLIWENLSGVVQKDQMTSVVTSGVGIYGPDMRIGTDADISVVQVQFTK